MSVSRRQPEADSRLARSKRLGERVEATVIQRVEELRAAPERDSRHDAIAEQCLAPSERLPFAGIALVEQGTPVEIKSVAAVQGQAEKTGRFYLREGQHAELLESAGVYVFVVAVPYPDRDPLAMKLVPASLVDELRGSWIEVDGRCTHTKLAWSHVFRDAEVSDGVE
ncbi:hypothetical protein [Haloglomus litoreum]|uniref:hypothetical protein n=1 Tax=Haloglomus litoreum TaxID=3034026 RepID=UPI0023E77474|nr:hypothetical protein [Haloglomus sp. DT116]